MGGGNEDTAKFSHDATGRLMRRIAALAFVTLDGVIQAPSMADEDRSGGFEHGGWAQPYWDDVMTQVMREAMAEPYDLLLGRRTYDLFARHWPDAPKTALSERINAARKYVVTSDPASLAWANSAALTGDAAAAIRALKAADGPLLQIHGSGQLIQTLLAQGLIDELRLWTFPVVLGGGKRLFGQNVPPAAFNLIKAEPSGNGAVMSIYRLLDPPHATKTHQRRETR